MTPASHATQIEALVRQLGEQAEHYRGVLAFAERQQAALTAQDMAEFNALLAEKAGLMDTIARLDLAMAQNRAVWDAQRDDLDETLRSRVRAAVEEVRGLLEHVLETELACEAQLQEAKGGLTQELRQLGHGQRALESYRTAAPPTPAPRLDLGG